MQLYDAEAGQFLADRYVTGECPHCHHPSAYGDQCEALRLVAQRHRPYRPSQRHHRQRARTASHPPLVSAPRPWEPTLRRWILDGHKEWKTNVYGQCKVLARHGTAAPCCVSRDLSWGVPVPVEGAEGKVLYAWFDAPIGYISNTKELMPDSWETWWKDPETRIINFIGKG